MKKFKDLPKKERAREKPVEKGAHSLNDRDLLVVILDKGAKVCTMQ